MSDMTQEVHRELHNAIDQACKLSKKLQAAEKLLEEAKRTMSGIIHGRYCQVHTKRQDDCTYCDAEYWMNDYEEWKK